MNVLDIILLIPLIWLTYKGFRRGFVLELASLAGLILGIWAAIHFSYFAADIMSDFFEMSPKYMNITAFIVTFVIVVLLVYLLGKIIEQFVNILALGFLNKLAGSVFGLIKAAFILSVIILIINMFDDDKSVIKPKWREGSLLYSTIEGFAPAIIPKLNIEELEELDLGKEKGKRVV